MTQMTFTASQSLRPTEPITIEVVKTTQTEVTGTRLPADTFGHTTKTWMLSEINVVA